MRALARKHGGSLDAALLRRGEMREELARCTSSGERLGELEREIEARGTLAAGLSEALSKGRKEAAARLSEAVERELEGLAMGQCRLTVALLPLEGGFEFRDRVLSVHGAERVEILIAPNPGEAPRPLARIASGGELSRLLLAVKRVLSKRDPVSTYVFDEVDAGIGGAVAEAMGRVLRDVSRGRQVVCITHLAQVAAFADRHHVVEKAVSGGRTHTTVTPLDGAQARRGEVARMMAGSKVTATALEHAAALLELAHRPKAAREGVRLVPARAVARKLLG